MCFTTHPPSDSQSCSITLKTSISAEPHQSEGEADVSLFGKVSDVSRQDNLFYIDEEEAEEGDEGVCESRTRRKIKEQHELTVGKNIELHGSGLSPRSPGLQVR